MLYGSTLTWEEKEQEHSSSLFLIFIFFPLNKLLYKHQNMLMMTGILCVQGDKLVWEMSIVPEHMAIFQTRREALQKCCCYCCDGEGVDLIDNKGLAQSTRGNSIPTVTHCFPQVLLLLFALRLDFVYFPLL